MMIGQVEMMMIVAAIRTPTVNMHLTSR